MLFTSTDQNQFWDEEISFDVHDVHNVDIPPEALLLPPIEVMDLLFEIYYQVMPKGLFFQHRFVSMDIGPWSVGYSCCLFFGIGSCLRSLDPALLRILTHDPKSNSAPSIGRSIRASEHISTEQRFHGGISHRRLFTPIVLYNTQQRKDTRHTVF